MCPRSFPIEERHCEKQELRNILEEVGSMIKMPEKFLPKGT